MIVCEYCGWRGSGEHDCQGNMLDTLHAVVEERNSFEAENATLRQQLADVRAENERLKASLATFTAFAESLAATEPHVRTKGTTTEALLDKVKELQGVRAERDRLKQTVDSIAVMLGWMNRPPQRTLEDEIRILKSKAAGTLANNLCPDHRDKQTGKLCLACTAEKAEAELENRTAKLFSFAKDNGHLRQVCKTICREVQRAMDQIKGYVTADVYHTLSAVATDAQCRELLAKEEAEKDAARQQLADVTAENERLKREYNELRNATWNTPGDTHQLDWSDTPHASTVSMATDQSHAYDCLEDARRQQLIAVTDRDTARQQLASVTAERDRLRTAVEQHVGRCYGCRGRGIQIDSKDDRCTLCSGLRAALKAPC